MRLAIAPAVLILAAAAAPAQTGAPLLLSPWSRLGDDPRREARIEFSATGGRFLADTDIDGTDEELGLTEWGAEGRFKLSDRLGAAPALGFDALQLHLDTEDPALPERLGDHAVAAAWGWNLDERWRLGVVGGVGYAGTRPFAEADSLYLMGDIVLTRDLDDGSALMLSLNYHGNRSLLPDVPLPGISYSRRSGIDGLRYTVGFPYSSVVYQPDDRWMFRLGYTLPFNFQARAEYQVADTLTAFGLFDTFTRGFWLEDDPGNNERIFFTQRRLEGGLRYEAHTGVELTAAAGYAFGQEFTAGWDARDTDDVREIDPAPYVRLGVALAF